jgi:hypothetical protein
VVSQVQHPLQIPPDDCVHVRIFPDIRLDQYKKMYPTGGGRTLTRYLIPIIDLVDGKVKRLDCSRTLATMILGTISEEVAKHPVPKWQQLLVFLKLAKPKIPAPIDIKIHKELKAGIPLYSVELLLNK